MKRKRIIILTLLVLALLTVTGKANAEPAEHYHGHIKYEPWPGTDGGALLPAHGGYYYLTEDIIRGETAPNLTIPAGVTQHLCLNGHTITHRNTGDRLYTVKGDFYLEDCGENPGGIFYGGVTASTCSYGALLNIQRGGTVTMTGGQIYGLSSTHETGAAVCVQGANTSARAVFNLLEGTIHSNTAAICMPRLVSGPAQENFSQVNICGGSIRGNGSAIAVTTDMLQITGGVITENQGPGPAVHVGSQAKLRLSGGPYIAGNQTGNLYLGGDGIIELGTLAPEARVGLSAEKPCRIISLLQGPVPENCLFSDDPQYGISLQEQGVFLGYDHEHPLAGEELVKWHSWTDGKHLPTVSGNYRLEQDIYLEEETVVEKNTVLNLCLNGHSIIAAPGNRIMKITAGSCVNVTDCSPTPGRLAGGSSVYGGGFYVSRQGSLSLYNGIITENTAQKGGGVYVQAESINQSGGQFQMFGGQILANSAEVGGGIYGDGKCPVLLAGGCITGNQATQTGGGIYVRKGLQMQGSPVVEGNSDNIYLASQACITVSQLEEGARLFVSAQNPDRPITDRPVEEGVARCFFSDSQYRLVEHQEFIYLNRIRPQVHCNCGGSSKFCDHDEASWQAWESTTELPKASGHYYLLSDVVLTEQVGILGGQDISLCLNGHTVTAAKERRLFQVHTGGLLTITDCAGGGQLTGGNCSYGGAINIMRGAQARLYGGAITGNTAGTTPKGLGSGIYLQEKEADVAGGIFCMYGGKLSENTGYQGAIYAGSGSTLLLYGGSITHNRAESHGGGVYLAANADAAVENVTIAGNTAGKRGAGIYQSAGAGLSISNTQILENSGMDTGSALYLGGQFRLEDCRITGNVTSKGTAVYAAPATDGIRQLGGDLWIWDNTGTMKADLYLGKGLIVTGTEQGFGRNTRIRVQIYAGFLTDTLLAAYDYEGGNRVYTVTYGTKSLTDPEKEPVPETKPVTESPKKHPIPSTVPVETQPKPEETVEKPLLEDNALPGQTPVAVVISRSIYGLGIVVASSACAVVLLRRKKPKQK